MRRAAAVRCTVCRVRGPHAFALLLEDGDPFVRFLERHRGHRVERVALKAKGAPTLRVIDGGSPTWLHPKYRPAPPAPARAVKRAREHAAGIDDPPDAVA